MTDVVDTSVQQDGAMVTIRPADTGDVEAITDLTNALIDRTTYEWAEARHTVDERTAWLDDHRAAGHPVFDGGRRRRR